MLSHYDEFRHYLEDTCGIVLGENKEYLVSSRLGRIMREKDLADLGALLEQLKGFSGNTLKQQIIDAMTTNETLWFRDNHPYDILNKVIFPDLQGNMGGIRIWSAACSSGQEPYSISMVAEEYNSAHLTQKIPRLEILATDLSSSILDAAKQGVYEELALNRGLSDQRRQRHFQPLTDKQWQVKPAVKSRVRFQSLNLLESYQSLGKFDVIFCRNVLIYFSADVKQDILRRMHACLKPGGYLFLGGSEALSGLNDLFTMQHCRPGIVYRAQ